MSCLGVGMGRHRATLEESTRTDAVDANLNGDERFDVPASCLILASGDVFGDECLPVGRRRKYRCGVGHLGVGNILLCFPSRWLHECAHARIGRLVLLILSQRSLPGCRVTLADAARAFRPQQKLLTALHLAHFLFLFPL